MILMIADYDDNAGGAGKVLKLEAILLQKENREFKVFYGLRKPKYSLLDIPILIFKNFFLLFFFLFFKRKITKIIVHTYSLLPVTTLLTRISSNLFIFVAHDYSLISPCKSHFNLSTQAVCKLRGYSENCLSANCGTSNLKKAYMKFISGTSRPNKVRALSNKSLEIFKSYDYNNVYNVRNVKSFNSDIIEVPIQFEEFIIFIGRYTLDKGFDLYNQIAEKFSNLKFYSCGHGEVQPSKNVIDLGWCNGAEVNFLLQKSSLVVYPSRQIDADPLVVQQCIEYGKKVLVPSWNAAADDVRKAFGEEFIFTDLKNVDIQSLLRTDISVSGTSIEFPTKFLDLYPDE